MWILYNGLPKFGATVMEDGEEGTLAKVMKVEFEYIPDPAAFDSLTPIEYFHTRKRITNTTYL